MVCSLAKSRNAAWHNFSAQPAGTGLFLRAAAFLVAYLE